MTKLPILMYHSVSQNKSEGLTISVDKLEAHCKFLTKNAYRTYHLAELENLKTLPHKKNVVITFDDGFVNQLNLALPLLEKYKMKATFFIPLNFLGKTDEWNPKAEQQKIMNLEQLKSLNPTIIELAYHSFYHQKYNELTAEEIAEDSKRCFEFAEENQLNFFPAIAYPYGKFPRKNPEKDSFIDQLKAENFKFGLRIGNRLNKFPFKNNFEIERIDVKGEFSFKKFQRKLKWGKLF